MRAVVQRASRAKVTVEGKIAGEIGAGLMVLLGVGVDDGESDARQLAEKIVNLRIFRDGDGAMNRSLIDTGGSVLLVSQFTLHGDARKGRRPSFIAAARGERAEELYRLTGETIAAAGVEVRYGVFGADMAVELVNDGPVTILLDTKRAF